MLYEILFCYAIYFFSRSSRWVSCVGDGWLVSFSFLVGFLLFYGVVFDYVITNDIVFPSWGDEVLGLSLLLGEYVGEFDGVLLVDGEESVFFGLGDFAALSFHGVVFLPYK